MCVNHTCMHINHAGRRRPPLHLADRPVTYVSLHEGSSRTVLSVLTTTPTLSSSPPVIAQTRTANNSPLHLPSPAVLRTSRRALAA